MELAAREITDFYTESNKRRIERAAARMGRFLGEPIEFDLEYFAVVCPHTRVSVELTEEIPDHRWLKPAHDAHIRGESYVPQLEVNHGP